MKKPKKLMDRTDELYREAREQHGAAMQHLARGYEADPDRRRDRENLALIF
jgi:hypothetical protein